VDVVAIVVVVVLWPDSNAVVVVAVVVLCAVEERTCKLEVKEDANNNTLVVDTAGRCKANAKDRFQKATFISFMAFFQCECFVLLVS
jgi:hypothetical protein